MKNDKETRITMPLDRKYSLFNADGCEVEIRFMFTSLSLSCLTNDMIILFIKTFSIQRSFLPSNFVICQIYSIYHLIRITTECLGCIAINKT